MSAPTVSQIRYAANKFRAQSLLDLLTPEPENKNRTNELGKLSGSAFVEHLFGNEVYCVNSLTCDAMNFEDSPFDEENTLLARNIIAEAKTKMNIKPGNTLQEGALFQLRFATACVEHIGNGEVTLNVVLNPEFVAGTLAGVSTLTLPATDLCRMGHAQPRLMDCLSLIRRSAHNTFYLLGDSA